MLFLCYSLTPAQDNSTESKDSIKNYQIYGFGAGVGFINHPEFDKFLNSYGWKGNLKDVFTYISLEMGWRSKKSYFAVNVDLPFDGIDNEEKPISFSLHRFCAGLSYGYAFKLKWDFEIMPNIGYILSRNNLIYHIRDSLGSDVNFDDLLRRNYFSFEVSSLSIHGIIGLDISRKFGLSFLTLSLQYYLIGTNDWKINNSTKLNGIPDYNLGGFYMCIKFRPYIFELS